MAASATVAVTVTAQPQNASIDDNREGGRQRGEPYRAVQHPRGRDHGT